MRPDASCGGAGRAWPALAACAVAAAFAATSLGGLLLPSTYARETASWRAQGIGQDWFDLLVVVPLLVASGARASRGSRAARIILGGALVYALYAFVLYAFEVHFNALFLVYCAGLGLSFFSLAGVVAAALREDGRATFDDAAALRLAGGLLAAVGLLFGALWLSEVAPALARGEAPPSLAEGGFFTNPVHVLDLSLVLPAMIASGVSLARRRPFGCAVGPMLLAFNALMPLAIVAMIVAMRARGVPAGLAPVPVLGAIALASLAALALLGRRPRRDAALSARYKQQNPPSMAVSAPVTKSEAGEAR